MLQYHQNFDSRFYFILDTFDFDFEKKQLKSRERNVKERTNKSVISFLFPLQLLAYLKVENVNACLP